MVYYVFQAQRESGMLAEWNIEAKRRHVPKI